MTPETHISDVSAENGVVTIAINTGGGAPIRVAMSVDAASALADAIKAAVARTARIEIADPMEPKR